MSDEEDDEITDPKHKFTAKCEKTNACAKLLVSWPRHAHASEESGRLARGRVLNAPRTFLAHRWCTRSAPSASRPKGRDSAPDSSVSDDSEFVLEAPRALPL